MYKLVKYLTVCSGLTVTTPNLPSDDVIVAIPDNKEPSATSH